MPDVKQSPEDVANDARREIEEVVRNAIARLGDIKASAQTAVNLRTEMAERLSPGDLLTRAHAVLVQDFRSEYGGERKLRQIRIEALDSGGHDSRWWYSTEGRTGERIPESIGPCRIVVALLPLP